MRGGEKPFEILSSKEKEAFELTSEILLWANNKKVLTWPGALELKKWATRLHEMVSNMDMEHDDRYYEIHAEVDRLKMRYQELKQLIDKTRETKYDQTIINADIEHGNLEELMRDIERLREQGKCYIYVLHENDMGFKYGDWVEVQILGDENQDKWNVRVNEMLEGIGHPYTWFIRAISVGGRSVGDFLNIYRKRYSRQLGAEDYNEDSGYSYDIFDDPYAPYTHEEGSQQVLTEVRALPWEEARKLVQKIFETIKAHPRKHLFK